MSDLIDGYHSYMELLGCRLCINFHTCGSIFDSRYGNNIKHNPFPFALWNCSEFKYFDTKYSSIVNLNSPISSILREGILI